jgi:hypothetical protein
MKRLAWATDVHLNFLALVQLEAFCQDVERHTPDALFAPFPCADRRVHCRIESPIGPR